MNISVIQNVKSLLHNPYPHVCVEDALPEKIYNELEETFPEELVCSTQPHDGGITYRYKANPALIDRKIPQIWQDFFDYHTSEDYFKEVISLFEPSIEKHYPHLLDDIERLVAQRDITEYITE